MKSKKVAVLGTVGVPAIYGGFETLVENLVRYHGENNLPVNITVYCSSKSYNEKKASYLSAGLKYIPMNANGAQSVPYDLLGLLSAVWNRNDVLLQLGVSGAIAIPFVRLASKARIITNIDGIEWRRDKWSPLAKWFLRLSEKVAVSFSHEIIADNAGIAEYVKQQYGINAHVIAYGGDHAVAVDEKPVDELGLPESYAFSVCRIEPENNVEMIVEAFANQSNLPLVMVGNWNNSEYGRGIRHHFVKTENLFLLDPIYDLGKLKTLRANASLYVHGHSAGGTNPSLVEAMHFAKPVLAYDCVYNRATTENQASYFDSGKSLGLLLESFSQSMPGGGAMQEIAKRKYTWAQVAKEYFDLILK